jgi:hypothetical protein
MLNGNGLSAAQIPSKRLFLTLLVDLVKHLTSIISCKRFHSKALIYERYAKPVGNLCGVGLGAVWAVSNRRKNKPCCQKLAGSRVSFQLES